MIKQHDKKWWDHLLMRAQNLLGIILSLAALTAILVSFGGIPEKLAQAQNNIKALEGKYTELLINVTDLKSGQQYTNKTLDEIKSTMLRNTKSSYN